MSRARFLTELAQRYEGLHTSKEDAFWNAYMGLCDDADAARRKLDEAEVELKRFLRDPELQDTVRAQLAALADSPVDTADTTGAAEAEHRTALEGWLRTLEAHGIASAEGRAQAEEIVEAEGSLARARGSMKLGYIEPGQGFQTASSVKLAVMLNNDPDSKLRKAAWEGLRSIEDCVLASGFVELIRERNRLGRSLGGEDFYDWTVRRTEGLTKREIFSLLDELERETRECAQRSLLELAGSGKLTPWDVRYAMTGDVTREQDPYFPFEKAIERWGRSFAALGIDYRGARMVLDLLDRKGKYENGFMHGPEIAWRDAGNLKPARIQFTANAIPGMVGSGHRATATLFHEGGHAAHFANIDMPAPCFGQEFAPTSVAFAETQSMFLDSLIDDADWQARYAHDLEGKAIPWELIRKGIEKNQPYAAWGARTMLAVCYGEKAIYEIPDAELSATRILEELREVERRMLFLDEGSPRPVLSVPHLLAGESCAYYHGYVMAEMAVQQTRHFFLERDGHLVDNPRIGPELCQAYWRPGNSKSFKQFVRALTGKELSASLLSEKLNRSVDETLDRARKAYEAAAQLPQPQGAVELNAKIRVAHGKETVAELDQRGFGAFAADFEGWIGARATAAQARS